MNKKSSANYQNVVGTVTHKQGIFFENFGRISSKQNSLLFRIWKNVNENKSSTGKNWPIVKLKLKFVFQFEWQLI